MSDTQVQYPDITGILERKADGRRKRASLGFARKLVLLDALRERVQPIARARQTRKGRSANSNLSRS